MKCPICGIEMRLTGVKDGRQEWTCRNPKCPQCGKNEAKEAQKDGAD